MDEKNNRPEGEEGIAKKVSRKVKGIAHFLKGEKKIIIEKEQIESILPHKGRMLLLDRVIITPEKITGEFKVTEQVCEGHAVWEDGTLVFRGSDFFDMASQLLGVGVAHGSNFERKERRTGVHEYGGAKFGNPTFPGELLLLEIEADNISSSDVYGDGSLIIVKGKNFFARASDVEKARVYSVEIFISQGLSK